MQRLSPGETTQLLLETLDPFLDSETDDGDAPPRDAGPPSEPPPEAAQPAPLAQDSPMSASKRRLRSAVNVMKAMKALSPRGGDAANASTFEAIKSPLTARRATIASGGDAAAPQKRATVAADASASFLTVPPQYGAPPPPPETSPQRAQLAQYAFRSFDSDVRSESGRDGSPSPASRGGGAALEESFFGIPAVSVRGTKDALLTAEELNADIAREHVTMHLDQLQAAVAGLADDMKAWREETAGHSSGAAVVLALKHLAHQADATAALTRLQQSATRHLISFAGNLRAALPQHDPVAAALQAGVQRLSAGQQVATPVRRAGSAEDGYTPDRLLLPHAVPQVTVTDSGDLAVPMNALLQALHDGKEGGGVAPMQVGGGSLIDALVGQRAGLVSEVERLTGIVDKIRRDEGALRTQHQQRAAQMLAELEGLRRDNAAFKAQQAKNREKAEAYLATFEQYRGQMAVLRERMEEVTRENYLLRRDGCVALDLPPAPADAAPVHTPPPRVAAGVAHPKRAPRVFSTVAAPPADVDIQLNLSPEPHGAAPPTPPVPVALVPSAAGGAARLRDRSTDPEFDVLSNKLVSRIERLGLRLASPEIVTVEALSPEYHDRTPQCTRSVSPSRYLSETPHHMPPAYSPSLSLPHASKR